MERKKIHICLIGQKFMGRAHSNAYLKVDKFFKLPAEPVMQTVAGRDEKALAGFAGRWGWKHHSTDWRAAAAADPAIDLVDITAPNHMHPEMAIAALNAGKHVACEKPLARTLDEARTMLEAARKNPQCKTYVWWSYRRCPAVALAHHFVKAGKIGRIYHVRGYYLQDWAGPSVPLIWRFDKEISGSGSHGDLGAHVIDMARFVTGLEITKIDGAIAHTFFKQRQVPSQGSAGGIAAGARAAAGTMKDVHVDDATLFLCHFGDQAIGQFEATRLATGYQNKNGVEIHGERGAVRFNFEEMNYLDYFDNTADKATAGWTRIPATNGAHHPYAHAWWPSAHIIGYEHTFINQTADMIKDLAGEKPEAPLGDFEDAYQTQRVLEAVLRSAAEGRAVEMDEVK